MQNKNILFGIIGLAVVGLVGYGLMSSSDKKEMMKDDVMMMKEKEAMMQKDAMDKEAMMKKEIMEKESVMQKDGMMKKEEVMEKTSMTKESVVSETMKKDDAMMVKDGSMMKKEPETMMKKEEVMVKAGSYSAYSATKLAENTNGKNVLFFHAAWCPSCKSADAAIGASLSTIPAGVQILKVDYDTSADLKQKYGVTYQHTFVQVDASGTMLAKWSGSKNVEEIISKLK